MRMGCSNGIQVPYNVCILDVEICNVYSLVSGELPKLLAYKPLSLSSTLSHNLGITLPLNF